MIEAHGAIAHIIPGNRDHCADVCRSIAREKNLYYANHVYNPFFYEGTKTYIYETYEQLYRIPEHIFIPVGNGTLFLGIIKGLEHLLQSGIISHMPQLYLVQSEYCQPLLKAMAKNLYRFIQKRLLLRWRKGLPLACPCAVLRFYHMYTNIMSRELPFRKILAARSPLARQGIYCEHTTAAVYAGYESYCQEHGTLSDVLISMCGAGLKSDHG